MPIKTNNELGLVVDIARFNLVQKLSNLVISWLSKMPLKVTKIIFENNLIWVEFVNFGGLLCFIYV